jgi:hypothetical protein
MDRKVIVTDGYFTWMQFLFDTPSWRLEQLLGFSPESLKAGWLLASPQFPLAPADIDLRGSTRWSDGVMKDGRAIGALIAERSSLSGAQRKLASFFDRGPDRRPAKVFPHNRPTAYPAADGGGIPQFRLNRPLRWQVLLEVPPGQQLDRARLLRALP